MITIKKLSELMNRMNKEMDDRRKGDMDDPRGGVRHVIPEKGNYTK